MIAFTHNRTSRRIQSEAPVILEDFRTGFDYRGTLLNYSTEGAYFWSSYAPRPGRKIRIKIDGLPDVFIPHTYLAEVRWRRLLPENPSSYAYGLGIKYC